MSFPAASVTPPTLADWQYSLAGFTWGSQCVWGNVESDGLDLPNVRSTDTDRARDTGSYAGFDSLGSRTITLTLFAQQGSSDALASQLQTLLAAVGSAVGGVAECPLWFKRPGFPQLATMVRVRRHNLKSNRLVSQAHLVKPTIQFVATDPRLYGPTTSATVYPQATVAGLVFPATAPWLFGAGTSVGVVEAANGGNIETRPQAVFTGPCLDPWLVLGSDPNLPGIYVAGELGSGDQLLVDFDAQTLSLIIAGTSSQEPVPGWLADGSEWFTLPPGSNLLQFSTADPSSAGSLTVVWAPAWSAVI